MHANSQLLFRRYAMSHFASGFRVLEIGPDGAPSTYRQAIDATELQWETAELDDALMPSSGAFRPYEREPTHLMRSEYEIPAPDDTFDIVLAGQVIEHVRRIWAWLPELARVTKPGGKVIILSPISWPYHPAPYDCWRIYPDGMRALCEEAGLDILLSRFESLEQVPSRRRYPGIGYDWLTSGPSPHSAARRLTAVIERLKLLIGWPMPIALDLITVARKPPTTGQPNA